MTEAPSIEDRIRRVVCESLSTTPDKVTLETSFINDLGADSLDTVELIMEFEDEFKPLQIPEEDAETIVTVQLALDYITKKEAAKPGSDQESR